MVYFDTDLYNVNSPGVWGNDDEGEVCNDGGNAIVADGKTDLDDDESDSVKL